MPGFVIPETVDYYPPVLDALAEYTDAQEDAFDAVIAALGDPHGMPDDPQALVNLIDPEVVAVERGGGTLRRPVRGAEALVDSLREIHAVLPADTSRPFERIFIPPAVLAPFIAHGLAEAPQSLRTLAGIWEPVGALVSRPLVHTGPLQYFGGGTLEPREHEPVSVDARAVEIAFFNPHGKVGLYVRSSFDGVSVLDGVAEQIRAVHAGTEHSFPPLAAVAAELIDPYLDEQA